MAKKGKAGLSRRKMIQLTKAARLKSRKTYSGADPKVLGIVQTVGSKEVKVVEVKGISIASNVRVAKKYRLVKPPALPTQKSANTIATAILQSSTLEVLRSLGIIPLKGKDKPEVTLTPELTGKVGRLVAAHTICMAGDYVAAGSKDGGGRIGAGGIIGSIGRSGVDVVISKEGEVTTKVTRKSTTSKKKKASKDAKTSTPDPAEVPKKGKKKKTAGYSVSTDVQPGGSTTIFNIHFDIHIDANIVSQLNVNPQEVKNELAKEIPSLTDIVKKKLLEAKAVEVEDDEEDDEEKKKKNGA